MKILVACEFSGIVREAFRRRGHDAWSCDLLRTSESNWAQPVKWNKAAKEAGVRRRVFCASLADVFEDRTELGPWRLDLCELIERCRNLDFLLLTKRPENVNSMIEVATGRRAPAWFKDCDNVWIGTSVENQATADVRVPILQKIPARVRFLSYEPALGPLDLRMGIYDTPAGVRGTSMAGIHWVIIGGESGDHARGFQIEWARYVVAQCRVAGAAPFVKQMGENPGEYKWDDSDTEVKKEPVRIRLKFADHKGGNPIEWPVDLRVREFPLLPTEGRVN